MKKFDFQKHYVSITLLSLLALRSLAVGASIGDSIVIIALAAFSGYSLFISNKNKDLDQQLREQLSKQDEHLLALQAKLDGLERINLEINDLRQQVGIIKMDKAYNNIQSSSINSQRVMAGKVTNAQNGNEKKRIF